MTDDEQTERRLHAMLHGRADRIDSQLSGPELRRRAAGQGSGRTRRLAPVLAAAAAVAVIATVTAVIASDDPQRDPAPVQPGGQTTVTATTPAPLPSTSAPPTTLVPRPTLVAPTASGSATATPTPRSTASASPVTPPTRTKPSVRSTSFKPGSSVPSR